MPIRISTCSATASSSPSHEALRHRRARARRAGLVPPGRWVFMASGHGGGQSAHRRAFALGEIDHVADGVWLRRTNRRRVGSLQRRHARLARKGSARAALPAGITLAAIAGSHLASFAYVERWRAGRRRAAVRSCMRMTAEQSLRLRHGRHSVDDALLARDRLG